MPFRVNQRLHGHWPAGFKHHERRHDRMNRPPMIAQYKIHLDDGAGAGNRKRPRAIGIHRVRPFLVRIKSCHRIGRRRRRTSRGLRQIVVTRQHIIHLRQTACSIKMGHGDPIALYRLKDALGICHPDCPGHRERIVPFQRRITASIIVTTLGPRPCTQKSRQNQSCHHCLPCQTFHSQPPFSFATGRAGKPEAIAFLRVTSIPLPFRFSFTGENPANHPFVSAERTRRMRLRASVWPTCLTKPSDLKTSNSTRAPSSCAAPAVSSNSNAFPSSCSSCLPRTATVSSPVTKSSWLSGVKMSSLTPTTASTLLSAKPAKLSKTIPKILASSAPFPEKAIASLLRSSALCQTPWSPTHRFPPFSSNPRLSNSNTHY